MSRHIHPAGREQSFPHVYRKGLSLDALQPFGPDHEPQRTPAWVDQAGALAMQGLPDEIAWLRVQRAAGIDRQQTPVLNPQADQEGEQ